MSTGRRGNDGTHTITSDPLSAIELRRLLPEAMRQAAVDGERTIVRRRAAKARLKEYQAKRREAQGMKPTPRTWTCKCGRHHKRLGLTSTSSSHEADRGLACPSCGDRP